MAREVRLNEVMEPDAVFDAAPVTAHADRTSPRLSPSSSTALFGSVWGSETSTSYRSSELQFVNKGFSELPFLFEGTYLCRRDLKPGVDRGGYAKPPTVVLVKWVDGLDFGLLDRDTFKNHPILCE